MTALTDFTLAEACAGLATKQFSARELSAAYIAAMEAARPLNAYITETPEIALDMAAASDERRARGEARPLEVRAPLHLQECRPDEQLESDQCRDWVAG